MMKTVYGIISGTTASNDDDSWLSIYIIIIVLRYILEFFFSFRLMTAALMILCILLSPSRLK